MSLRSCGPVALCATTTLLALAAPIVAYAQAQTFTFNIPAGDLASGLRAFAQQAHQQVAFDGALISGKSNRAVVGTYTAVDALQSLLDGTGFTARLGSKGEFVLSEMERSGVSSPGAGDAAQAATVSEVIVTAQKREEKLHDVPVSDTVVNQQKLSVNGISRLSEYFSQVPGLSLDNNAFGGGMNYVTIRGLSAGDGGNPTVAVVIDDVPIGSSTAFAFGQLTAADLDPSDLARVEVLKGPQGALYGASSLGGIIKYVTTAPSTNQFDGRLEVSSSDVLGHELGYSLRGAVNIPVSSDLALRASTFSRIDPGYVNNLSTGQKGINSADVYGGRIAGLWQISDRSTLTVSALIQHADGDGNGTVNADAHGNPVQGDLKQTSVPRSNKYTDDYELYSANLDMDLGFGKLRSLTGYSINDINSAHDVSVYALVSLSDTPYSIDVSHYRTSKFSQELRFSASVGRWLEFGFGAFYTREDSLPSIQTYYSASADGSIGENLITAIAKESDFEEHALFGDMTLHFNDAFKIQVGGRQSWDRVAQIQGHTGKATRSFYGYPSPYIEAEQIAQGSPFTFLVTPQYNVTSDVVMYGRIASGYRAGGPNAVSAAGLAAGAPRQFEPDTTVNYEIGLKADFLDHRLTLDTAAYYIHWDRFQVPVTTPNYHIANAGSAKSEGVEASVTARPTTGLIVSAQGSYNDAELTEDLPPAAVAAGAYGLKGYRLPYNIKWSGGVSVEQKVALQNGSMILFGGDLSYVGSRPGELANNSTATRSELPDYTRIDLHAGLQRGGWLVNVYLNNVGDVRGVNGLFLASNAGNIGAYSASYIQPRTLGITLAKTF